MNVTATSPRITHTRIDSGYGGHVSALRMRYERELAADPALVARILNQLLPVLEPERCLIRTDRVSVDLAVRRALVLAVKGIDAGVELRKE